MKSFWGEAKNRFFQEKWGVFGACILALIAFLAIYAPFFASSKPIAVCLNGEWYFPLFRYYLSSIFFTKPIDLFFNALGVVLFCAFVLSLFWKNTRALFWSGLIATALLFIVCEYVVVIDPARGCVKEKTEIQPLNFADECASMTSYARLNMVLSSYLQEKQHERILKIFQEKQLSDTPYTLFSVQQMRLREKLAELENRKDKESQLRLAYIQDKEDYQQAQKSKIEYIFMPLFRPLHWEDDAGGDQALNRELPFQELTRLNRQDLLSALIFGARIALFVGFLATFLQLLLGIPLGLISGYFAGRVDIVLSRFVEIWESMPAFFMLLLIITILQTKSLTVIIVVIALFSWTSTFRFVRAETFRQREIPYIEATHALGFSTSRILFHHLLPNAIVPVIALLPFDIMGAITREAGISFLGLGEELSCSWGQLMDEGRAAFPAESQLLWPPAVALTILLMAIAFVGDALITALNPKQR